MNEMVGDGKCWEMVMMMVSYEGGRREKNGRGLRW